MTHKYDIGDTVYIASMNNKDPSVPSIKIASIGLTGKDEIRYGTEKTDVWGEFRAYYKEEDLFSTKEEAIGHLMNKLKSL